MKKNRSIVDVHQRKDQRAGGKTQNQMKRLNITATIINITDKLKPLLVKILPITFLRNIKKGMVDSAMEKLESEEAIIPFSRTANPDGVNLIGYIRGEIGLGESCRLVAGGLEKDGLDFTVYYIYKRRRFNYI